MSEMETSMVGRSDTTDIHQKINYYLAILLFNETERKTAEDVVHRMVKRAVEMEGTVTGEHGVGLIKRDYLEHELGTNAVDAMRKVIRFPSRTSM
jgi:FAD/FMN-containing dehydrogenase